MGGGVYWIYSSQNAVYNTSSASSNATTTDSDTTVANQNLTPLSTPVSAEDYKIGPDDAAVVLVEYADFQCPACLQLSPVFKSMVDKFPGKVQFVYRHFPLSYHSLAKDAAKIADAAGKQGKFYEMIQFYFDNPSFSLESAYEHALALGLDTERMKSEIANGDYDAAIEADIASGNSSGVAGTPTIFMNGRQLPWEETTDLENTIKKELGV